LRGNRLLHQQHLPGALDRTIKLALIMGGQAGIFAGQNSPLVCHELLEQVRIFEIKRINGEVNFWLRPGCAHFRGPGAATAAATLLFVSIGFAGHKII
jgi:hypothetical protein